MIKLRLPISLFCMFSLCLSILTATAKPPIDETAASPNVLFILIDDLGWKDLSCYGSKAYQTPAIDALAADGMRFTSAYQAAPRCVSSRTAIMTGKYPYRPGVQKSGIPLGEFTIAEAFKENGYTTYFAGKWHLGKGPENWPDKQGFDINIGGCDWGAPKSYFFPYNKGQGMSPPGLENGEEGEYITDRLTEETIDFLKNHKAKNPDKPFFAMLSHYAVHTPLEAKEHLIKRHQARFDEMGLPKEAVYENDFTGKVRTTQNDATYAAMIESMDRGVGRVLKTLDRLGYADNTIVLFTSDHGGLSTTEVTSNRPIPTSNLPLRTGKGWLYEGGTRMPLIVKWPGTITPGSVTDKMTNGTDFYATLLDMAGLPSKPKQHLDSVSFTPILNGDSSFSRDPIIWYYMFAKTGTGNPAMAALRDGNMKLVYFPVEDRHELYDVSTDVAESKDLAATQPERAEQMKKRILEWRDELGIDPLDPKHNFHKTTLKLMEQAGLN